MVNRGAQGMSKSDTEFQSAYFAEAEECQKSNKNSVAKHNN